MLMMCQQCSESSISFILQNKHCTDEKLRFRDFRSLVASSEAQCSDPGHVHNGYILVHWEGREGERDQRKMASGSTTWR